MPLKNIQKTYSEIFNSYGNLTIETHISKIIELDAYLPYSSTFFCTTNTQDLSFEFISKNMTSCLFGRSIFCLKVMSFTAIINDEDVDVI